MTVKQKQCLLCYLGFYNGAIDGIRGPKSREAEARFCTEFGLQNFDETDLKKAICDDDRWGGIRHFSRAEFACKCGKFCDGYPNEMHRLAVEIADDAREYFGKPAIVVSGLRCQQHNANVGGVVNSRHLYGEAVDLKIPGVSADELLAFLQKQPGVRYAYAINATNVHFDIEKGGRQGVK